LFTLPAESARYRPGKTWKSREEPWFYWVKFFSR